MPRTRKPTDHQPHLPEDPFAEPSLRRLLTEIQSGSLSIDAALDHLKHLPFEETDHATLDHHRTLRKGFCEVIYCQGKTPEQVADIAARLAQKSPRLLGTRASLEHFTAARAKVPQLHYDQSARVLWLDRHPTPKKPGTIVIAAGTSDLPVAEEAAITLEVMGHAPVRIRDVGIAGLHRLLKHLPTLQKANAIVAVAGMEGALPSVVAGLVSAPVIAVPTSVGYGAAFHGVAALLAMLNSCASGLAVVNIDNGFGAGYMAALINAQSRPRASAPPPTSRPRRAKILETTEGGE
jgi:pyridinium-3,5-biscarboxylic acid mononucleotide synthase